MKTANFQIRNNEIFCIKIHTENSIKNSDNSIKKSTQLAIFTQKLLAVCNRRPLFMYTLMLLGVPTALVGAVFICSYAIAFPLYMIYLMF